MKPNVLFRGGRGPIRPVSLRAVVAALAVVASSLAAAACTGPLVCSPAIGSIGALPAAGQVTSGQLAQAGQPVVAAAPGRLSAEGTGKLGPGAAGGRTGQAPQRRLPVDSTVTLPTGQRIRLAMTPGGELATPVLPAADGSQVGSSDFIDFSWAGDQYMIPDDAAPYLGTILDPRLFDVSYLALAQLARPHGTNLPADVTYGNGSTAPLSSAQAARLGQQLASRWHAGRTGIPGMSRISLAQRPGDPALPAALPTAPVAAAAPSASDRPLRYHTLTLDFTGPDGKPATAIGWVQNLQDTRLGTFFVLPAISAQRTYLGTPGPLSFSVPEGTYSIQFTILTPHAGTAFGSDAALVVKPQVTISSDEAITLDARAATPYHAAVTPAVPHTAQIDELSYTRASAAGGGCGDYSGTLSALGLVSVSGVIDSSLPGFTPSLLSATPTAQVTTGGLAFNASTSLFTYQPGAATAPEYDLEFPHQGSIPASLAYTVPQSKLATVHEQVYDSPPGSCEAANGLPETLASYAYEPWGDWHGVFPNGQNMPYPPGDYTFYRYTSDPKLTIWQTENFGYPNSQCTTRWGPRQSYSPGQQVTETWNKGPQVPSPAAVPIAAAEYQLCCTGSGPVPLPASPAATTVPASRQDNNGMLYLAPFGDSVPVHYGDYGSHAPDGSGPASGLEFYRNGALAVSGQGQNLNPYALELPLLPTAADYQLDWTETPAGSPGMPVSTDWSFHSAPSDPAARLARGAECAPDPSRSCSFLPLLFLTYDLPLNGSNQAAAGQPLTAVFTVCGQQGAPPPTGASATVSASFDDGKTWSPPQAAASLGGDRFSATINQPSLAQTDGFASLRVTATDGAGNSVTQTIIRAYGLTS